MVNWLRGRVRFDRNELAGSFGDIGTDLPLIVGMILAVGLDGASTFIVFGATQILMGLIYGLPMPIQPLKAMAVIVISQKIAPDVLYGGGLAIGLIMLALALTGLLTRLADFIPRSVVRGLQLGLGLNLATLALKQYVPADGTGGLVLAAAALLVTVFLLGNRKCPAALLVVLLGAAYAAVFHLDFRGFSIAWAWRCLRFTCPPPETSSRGSGSWRCRNWPCRSATRSSPRARRSMTCFPSVRSPFAASA
jgi:hypothetical protein